MSSSASLAVVDIHKSYPGVIALKGVSLEFHAGEVHALIGKNGAGKSTLIRILSGSTSPTSGMVLLKGSRVEIPSPRDAIQKGIATVHQELSLIPNLSVGHNIMLTNLPTKLGGYVVDWPSVYYRATTILHELNLDIDVRAPARTLGIADQQMVEIAKSMVSDPIALLLDEPTSALAEHETECLFRLIKKLTAKGVAVIYISHRLRELQRIAHRVSVLREGQLVGTVSIEAANPQSVSEMMFGEVTIKHRPTDITIDSEVVLEANGLELNGKLYGVNLQVCRGEVLGIAGLVGSGRTELLRSLSGATRFDGGRILAAGVEVHRPSVRRMKRFGIGLAPENRKEAGLVLTLGTRENACMACLDRVSRMSVINRRLQESIVKLSIRDLRIKVSDTEAPVATLSGGNQQKVVVAKWLNTELRVFLLDEPTRGIDIEAKQQIFQVMWNLSRRGISSVFVSSELEELVEVCHRIAIMHDGRIAGYVNAEDVTPQQLFEYCVDPTLLSNKVTYG